MEEQKHLICEEMKIEKWRSGDWDLKYISQLSKVQILIFLCFIYSVYFIYYLEGKKILILHGDLRFLLERDKRISDLSRNGKKIDPMNIRSISTRMNFIKIDFWIWIHILNPKEFGFEFGYEIF